MSNILRVTSWRMIELGRPLSGGKAVNGTVLVIVIIICNYYYYYHYDSFQAHYVLHSVHMNW